MAEFTVIPDANLEPDKPARSIDALALRDNPIAIAEGAAGAPRIQTAAIQDGAVTAEKLAPPTAGIAHLIMRLQEAEISTDGTAYTNVGFHNRRDERFHLGVTVLVPGVITAYVQHRRTITTGSLIAYVRVLKNGVQVQEWSTTSSSFVTRQVDISVDVGDVIIFQQRISDNATSARWGSLRIYSNSPNMAVA